MAIALTYQPFAGLTGANELIAAWEALRQELSHYLDDETIAEVLRAAVYGAPMNDKGASPARLILSTLLPSANS